MWRSYDGRSRCAVARARRPRSVTTVTRFPVVKSCRSSRHPPHTRHREPLGTCYGDRYREQGHRDPRSRLLGRGGPGRRRRTGHPRREHADAQRAGRAVGGHGLGAAPSIAHPPLARQYRDRARRCTYELEVNSNLIVYRSRSQTEQDFYVGVRRDVLRVVDSVWKIARRKLILDHNVLLAKNVGIFFEAEKCGRR
jgi:hypothetical protein